MRWRLLNVLLELSIPLLKEPEPNKQEKVQLLALKGSKFQEELALAKSALYKLHTHFIETHANPVTELSHSQIAIFEKQRTTPVLYPRSPERRRSLHCGPKAIYRLDLANGQSHFALQDVQARVHPLLTLLDLIQHKAVFVKPCLKYLGQMAPVFLAVSQCEQLGVEILWPARRTGLPIQ